MSNENGRPWYKKPAYLGVIVAIIAIVVSIIIWQWPNPRPPSDFSISVNPLTGKTNPGGVAQTMVTIEDINTYKYPVMLSASEVSGIVVTFMPIGGPTPSYDSTMTISVNTNVPVGDYTITITALGADGKEHSSKYTLNVMPITPPLTTIPPPTPTVEPTTTPPPTTQPPTTTPPPAAAITSPQKGDEVPVSIIVRGTFSGELPEGQYMWVVVHPHTSTGQWWPQVGRIDPREGYQWDVPAWLGREKEDIGKKFDIAVILVNEKDDQYYWDYLRTGQEIGSYPGIPLPASANIIDRITVTGKSAVYVTDAFYPSGWMGDWDDITFDDGWTENSHSKPTSIKITYSAVRSQGEGWAGIYWQYPDKNWGDNPDGRDLTGATKLTFWARGEKGGEKAEFKVGGITGIYPDSITPPVSTGVIVLSNEWEQYTIDLTGKDLSHVIGGFVWVTNKNQNPYGCTIYLDDVWYE